MRLASDNIVLVCDKATELPLLQGILRRAWTAARSVWSARGTGRISIVRIERHSRPELAVLMQRLLAAGHSPPIGHDGRILPLAGSDSR